MYIYTLHERGSSSNKETLYFRPDPFRLLSEKCNHNVIMLIYKTAQSKTPLYNLCFQTTMHTTLCKGILAYPLQLILLFSPFGSKVFSFLCQNISLLRRSSFLRSISASLRLICSMIVIATSLSKLCVLVLCRKCSVSSQLLTLLLIWFL